MKDEGLFIAYGAIALFALSAGAYMFMPEKNKKKLKRKIGLK